MRPSGVVIKWLRCSFDVFIYTTVLKGFLLTAQNRLQFLTVCTYYLQPHGYDPNLKQDDMRDVMDQLAEKHRRTVRASKVIGLPVIQDGKIKGSSPLSDNVL